MQENTENKQLDNVITFPSEVIALPSKGLLYPKENPLSSGFVSIRYPRAREEDILTNQNLIQKGIVIDRFMQSIIVSPINYNDLVIGDKNGIMIAARMLAYGHDYAVELTCPKCGQKESEVVLDLRKVDFKDVNPAELNNTNEFEFTLPASKISITFKALTVADEKRIEEELKYLKKLSKDTPELTTRLKYIITSVNGNRDNKVIRDFVDKQLLSRDSLELRRYMVKLLPDVDMRTPHTCGNCGSEELVNIPMTVQFFWPHAGI